jgi:hypothetical protein
MEGIQKASAVFRTSIRCSTKLQRFGQPISSSPSQAQMTLTGMSPVASWIAFRAALVMGGASADDLAEMGRRADLLGVHDARLERREGPVRGDDRDLVVEAVDDERLRVRPLRAEDAVDNRIAAGLDQLGVLGAERAGVLERHRGGLANTLAGVGEARLAKESLDLGDRGVEIPVDDVVDRLVALEAHVLHPRAEWSDPSQVGGGGQEGRGSDGAIAPLTRCEDGFSRDRRSRPGSAGP